MMDDMDDGWCFEGSIGRLAFFLNQLQLVEWKGVYKNELQLFSLRI